MTARPWSQQKRDREKKHRVHQARQDTMRRNRLMDIEKANKRQERDDFRGSAKINYIHNTRKMAHDTNERRESLMNSMERTSLHYAAPIQYDYEGRGDPTVWGSWVQKAHR